MKLKEGKFNLYVNFLYNFSQVGSDEYDHYFEDTDYLPHVLVQRPVHNHFIYDIANEKIIGRVQKSTGKMMPV